MALKEIYKQLNPDIILLADTSHTPNQRPMKFYPYKAYTKNTARLSSGVAIFIKSTITHSLIDHAFISDTLALKVETDSGPVIIAVNYTPPRRPFLPTQDLNWLARHRTPAYLLADLNAHHRTFDHMNNARGRDLHNIWLRNGYLRLLGPPEGTFRTQRGRLSMPDLVLSNRSCYHYHRTENLESNLSDHSPIKLTISCSPIKIPCPPFENVNLANWPLFLTYIKNTVVPFNLNHQPIDTINQKIQFLSQKIFEAKELAIPISNHKLSNSNFTTDKFKRFQRILKQINMLIENKRHNVIRYNYLKTNKKL